MADAPPAPPSMAGVAQNTGDQQAQILGAIAKYGQAGADAYTQAQNAVQANRQQMLSNLGGLAPGAQALLSSQINADAAPTLASLQSGQANLAGDIARSNQMYTNYANEANAAIPVIQANTQNLMTIRDAALKQAQQQIDAENAAKAQAAQDAHNLALLQLQAEQERTKQAGLELQKAQATGSGSGSKPTFADLVGAATSVDNAAGGSPNGQAGTVGPGGRTGAAGVLSKPAGANGITDDMIMTAEDQAAYGANGDTRYSSDPTINLAKIVAAATGMSPAQINAIVTPEAVNAYESATAPVTPQVIKDATAALHGDAGGAAAVVNGSRWPAVQAQVNNFAQATLDSNGKITGYGPPWDGKTPWQAFSTWLTSPGAQLAPGDTKTMQVAQAFYKPFLDSLASSGK